MSLLRINRILEGARKKRIVIVLATIFLVSASPAYADSDADYGFGLPFEVSPYLRIDMLRTLSSSGGLLPGFMYPAELEETYGLGSRRGTDAGKLSGSIGAGLDFGPVRIDVSYNPRRMSSGFQDWPGANQADPSDGSRLAANELEMRHQSALISAYWDIADVELLGFTLTPYVGGRIGKVWSDIKNRHRFETVDSLEEQTNLGKSKSIIKGFVVGASLELYKNIGFDMSIQRLFTHGFSARLDDDPNIDGNPLCCTIDVDGARETRLSAGLRWTF